MKKENNKKNKNKGSLPAKIMALLLAGMMIIATMASLIYAIIYA